MNRFFDLPAEIRTLIIEYIALAERQPTYDSTIIATYEAAQAFGPEYCSRKNFEGVVYEDNGEDNCPTIINLLLTSRQMHNMALDCLSRSKSICKVDVAIMHGRNIWPTFVCIPSKRRKIDIVEATIHGAGDGAPCLQDWEARHSELPPISARFWRLLRNFMDGGPCSPSWPATSLKFQGNRSRSTSATTIGLLDLDVVDADPLHEKFWTNRHPAAFPSPSDGALCLLCHTPCRIRSPETAFVGLEVEYVFERLKKGFQILLNGLLTFYGLSLYTRVGRIRMRKRGMIIGEIDLGEVLNMLPLGSDECKMMTWIEWTKKERKQSGFSCPDESRRAKRLSSEEWHTFLREWCKKAISIDLEGL